MAKREFVKMTLTIDAPDAAPGERRVLENIVNAVLLKDTAAGLLRQVADDLEAGKLRKYRAGRAKGKA